MFFWSCNTSTFSAMHFGGKGEKEDKKAKGFLISHFYWSFSSDIIAVKGLKSCH